MENIDNRLSSNNPTYQMDVLDKFNNRIDEIDMFFQLLHKFESVNPTQLITVDDTIEHITTHDLEIQTGSNPEITVRRILNKLRLETPNIDLINIFKSNAILLLYNLVESTVSNADKFILGEISGANLLYCDASPEIKTFWIKHCSNFNAKEYLNTAISLLDNIQTVTIDVNKQYNENEKEFQGNLNPKTVDELLTKYGIEVTKTQMLQRETARSAVRNIAVWRNDLAHGKYSFAEFGRNSLRYEELVQHTENSHNTTDRENNILFIKKSCFDFLEIFLKNIETYIDNEQYKCSV
jgi:hypothetical protein